MKAKSPELLKLGERIRRYREDAEYSQDGFAYEVGLGRSYYGSLERGEINPSFMTLLKITGALNIELRLVIPDTLKVRTKRSRKS